MPDAPERSASGRIPFWAHQLAELLLGVVLLFEGARTNSHPAVIVAGALVIVYALLTDGPLGAWPRVPRKVHRVADLVIAALLAAAPFLLGISDPLAITLLIVAVVVMVWLALRSDFRTPQRRGRRRRAAAATSPPSTAASTPGTPAPGQPAQPASTKAPSVPSARDTGRALGRLRTGGARAVGRAVGKANAERAAEKAPREGDGADESPPE